MRVETRRQSEKPFSRAPLVRAVHTSGSLAETESPHGLSRVAQFVFFLLVALTAPLLLAVQASVGRQRGISLVLQVVIVAWTGLELSLLFGAGVLAPLRTVFWVYAYGWLGLPPLLSIVSGKWPLGVPPTDDVVIAGQVIILVGFAFYRLGHRFGHSEEGSAKRRSRTLSRSRCYMLVPVAVVGSIYYIHKVGISALFTSREQTQAVLLPGGYASADKASAYIVIGLGTAPALIAAYALSQLHRARVEVSTIVLTSMFTLNFVVNNPISNPRFWFATVILTFIFSASWIKRRMAFRVFLVALLLVSTVAFPYLAYFRYTNADARRLDNGSVVQTLEMKLDYDSTQQIQASYTYVTNHGHTDGRQMLTDLGFFVPRKFWPGKGPETGQMLAADAGYRYQNLSAPLWAEAYVDLGWIGLALIFGALGFFTRRCDGAFQRGGSGLGGWLAIAAPVLAGFEGIVVRGPLLQATGRIAILVFCLWFVTTPSTAGVVDSGHGHSVRRRRE